VDLTEMLNTHAIGQLFSESTVSYHYQDLTGLTLGAYSLVECIGKGGMGVVYRGVRSDGAFERTVAIKLINIEHLNQLTRSIFNWEQHVLASLRHPNIAELYDAGLLNDEIPFYIMEHVQGVSIDEYCRSFHLDFVERLHLFKKICEAVSHAHAFGVIHCDIKPANIIVTSEGVPKLLDFGVSKYADENKTEQPHFAAHTVRFASPEQLNGESVTFKSDIFQLGLLFENLIYPTCNSGLRNRDVDPGQSVSFGRLKYAQQSVQSILKKCTESSPENRYSGTHALVADIDCLLSNRPVSGLMARRSIVASLFFKRNYKVILVSVLTLLWLINASYWYIHEIQKARDIAEIELEKNQRMVSVFKSVFKHRSPQSNPQSPATADSLLDALESNLKIQFNADDPVYNEVALSLAELYLQTQNLDKAIDLLEVISPSDSLLTEKELLLALAYGESDQHEQAIWYAQRVAGHSQNTLDIIPSQALNQIRILQMLSAHAVKINDFKNANKYVKRALDIYQTQNIQNEALLASIVYQVGTTIYYTDASNSIPYLNRAENLFRESKGDDYIELINVYSRLADANYAVGNYENSERFLVRAKDLLETHHQDNPWAYILVYDSLGSMYSRNNNFNEAIMHHERAERKALEKFPNNLRLISMLDAAKARSMIANGQFLEGELLLRNIIDNFQGSQDIRLTSSSALAYSYLAWSLESQVKLNDALTLYRQAHDLNEKLYEYTGRQASSSRVAIARVLCRMGDGSEGRTMLQTAESLWKIDNTQQSPVQAYFKEAKAECDSA
jgi:eukaryotic-like serine/threonine-protein kinase